MYNRVWPAASATTASSGSKTARRQVCVFLGLSLKAPQIRSVVEASKSKRVHIIHIRHRDEVEAPITTWLQEAYELSDVLAVKIDRKRTKSKPNPRSPKRKMKAAPKRAASKK